MSYPPLKVHKSMSYTTLKVPKSMSYPPLKVPKSMSYTTLKVPKSMSYTPLKVTFQGLFSLSPTYVCTHTQESLLNICDISIHVYFM